jgi:hypothetical protein
MAKFIKYSLFVPDLTKLYADVNTAHTLTYEGDAETVQAAWDALVDDESETPGKLGDVVVGSASLFVDDVLTDSYTISPTYNLALITAQVFEGVDPNPVTGKIGQAPPTAGVTSLNGITGDVLVESETLTVDEDGQSLTIEIPEEGP